jgi:hypothetical protein
MLAMTLGVSSMQIDKNVEREIVNHRTLLHPNIIKFREAGHWLIQSATTSNRTRLYC